MRKHFITLCLLNINVNGVLKVNTMKLVTLIKGTTYAVIYEICIHLYGLGYGVQGHFKKKYFSYIFFFFFVYRIGQFY